MTYVGVQTALRSLVAGTLLLGGAGCYGTFLVAHQEDGQDGGQNNNTPDARVDAAVEVDADAGPLYPRFTEVECSPLIEYGFDVEEDEVLYCEFELEGPEGAPVQLGCQDALGGPLDCSPGNSWPPMEIGPRGAQTLPLTGSFYMEPIGLAGETVTVVWTATSGPYLSQLWVEFDVVEDQPMNPLELFIDCGGDTDWHVGVLAGATLECELELYHPDAFAPVGWAVWWQNHPEPMNEPQPEGGQGVGLYTWTWQTDAAEAGRQVLFAFRAGSQGGSIIGRDLIVDVF